jgi:hypothetical protein
MSFGERESLFLFLGHCFGGFDIFTSNMKSSHVVVKCQVFCIWSKANWGSFSYNHIDITMGGKLWTIISIMLICYWPSYQNNRWTKHLNLIHGLLHRTNYKKWNVLKLFFALLMLFMRHQLSYFALVSSQ